MDYQAIRDESDNDPESIGYAGKTNAEIAVLMNTKDRDGIVTSEEFSRWAAANGVAAKIRALAEDGAATDANRSFGIYGDQVLRRGDFELDQDNDDTVTLITGLKTGGALSVADVGSLKALAKNQQTRGEELGLGLIKTGYVCKAKAIGA